ncbi:MAG: IS30 family transposase, partial [Caulobacteraceae bacterium]
MGAHYDHLSLSDRREIYRLHEVKVPIRMIAERLGRHRSSIHRELRRNWFQDGRYLRGYFPITAQELTTRRRRRIGKLHRDPALAAHVVDRLNAAWSPEQIAGRLRHDAEPARQVCHETIYRFIYGPDGLARELHKLLPSRRKRRRPRAARRARGYKIPDSNTFARRPAEIGSRNSFGHWECDLVAFRLEYGKSNIRSLVERTSRYSFLSRNVSRHSAGVMSGLLRDLSSLPISARQTITFDRGTEFAGYATLKQKAGIKSYFCA